MRQAQYKILQRFEPSEISDANDIPYTHPLGHDHSLSQGTTGLAHCPEHSADLEHVEPAHSLLQAWDLVKGHRQHTCRIVVPAKLVSSIEVIAWGLEAQRPAECDRLDGAGRIQLGVVGLEGEQTVKGAGERRAKDGWGEDVWNAGSIKHSSAYSLTFTTTQRREGFRWHIREHWEERVPLALFHPVLWSVC
jgi:hypothetical protein